MRLLIRYSVHLSVVAILLWQYATLPKATAEELRFLLAPTAWGLELLLGIPFAPDADGYSAPTAMLLIAPECAGARFFLIALSLGYLFVPRLTAIPGIVLGAFLTTIIGNISRIYSLVLLQLYPQNPLHELIGSITFLIFLITYAYLVRSVVSCATR